MSKEKKNVALLSVVAAMLLTGLKFAVGIATGSLGILSEALHSGLDLLAAMMTFFAVRVSDKPADKEHNYGHGKIENLSALVETVLLFVTCIWIIYEAVSRLASSNFHIEVTVWSYAVVILSIIVDINRSRILYRVAKKHNSQALEADALHFSTDIWSSVVVLSGLIFAQFGIMWADSIAALGVAVIILVVSYRLGKRAVDVLLDKAPAGTLKIVQEVISHHSEIITVHDLKARTSGADTFIKFDIHFRPELTIYQAHEVCDKLEKEIHSLIPRSEIYIHSEPHKHEKEEKLVE